VRRAVTVETVRITGLPRHPAPAVAALSPDRYRLQVTIGGETLEKLRLARDMLRHAVPRGTTRPSSTGPLSPPRGPGEGQVRRHRGAAPSRGSAAGSRHIPAEVKRAVWLRDLGRCAFVAAEGRRCNERAFVEFHHVRPYAAGGSHVANIQLRCRRHNDLEARAFFGRGRGPAPRPPVTGPP